MNICPSCQVGRLEKRSMVYLEWHGKNLLVANRMPAMVCDVCGERVYDDRAIESLQRLLWAKVPNQTTAIPSRNS